MRKFVQIAVVFGLLASLALGQEGDRGNVLGWVEDSGGGKVAGADVVLVSRTFPARVDVGSVDVVRAKTDEKGRFRAACLRGRAYSAWASWCGDGTTEFSAIAEGVVPGPVVALRHASTWQPAEVVFQGLDAWSEFGEVTAVAFCGSKNSFAIPVKIGKDNKAQLPRMPGSNWEVEVRAGNGMLLTLMRGRQQASTVIDVPEARTLEVRVQNWGGDAIAGAEVSHFPCYSAGGRHPRLVGTVLTKTDRNGRATLQLPAKHPLSRRATDQIVRVVAKGYAGSLLTVPSKGVAATKGEIVTLTLNEGHSVTGVLLDAKKRPLADVGVFVVHPIQLNGKKNGFWGDPPVAIRTDAKGRFTANGLVAKGGCRVMLALSADEARRVGFAALDDRSLAPIQWIHAVEQVQGDIDIGTVSLADVPMCRLEVVDANKVPAADARVRLLLEGGLDAPIEFVTDRVGRLQFAFPQGKAKVGVYVPGGGVALADVVEPGTHAMRLELMPTRVVSGVVVDDKGKPVPGSRVMPWNRPQQLDYRLADLCYRSYRRSEVSDEDGKFRLVLPLAEPTFSIRALGTKGRGAASQLFAVTPETKEVELVLQSPSR